MSRYRVTLIIETPYNPNKWDWAELVASETDEEVFSVEIVRESDSVGGVA